MCNIPHPGTDSRINRLRHPNQKNYPQRETRVYPQVQKKK